MNMLINVWAKGPTSSVKSFGKIKFVIGFKKFIIQLNLKKLNQRYISILNTELMRALWKKVLKKLYRKKNETSELLMIF
jgi:hypothetical protein